MHHRLLLHFPNTELAPFLCQAGFRFAESLGASLHAVAIIDIQRMESVAGSTESAIYATVERDRVERVEEGYAALQALITQTSHRTGRRIAIDFQRGSTVPLLRREMLTHDLLLSCWPERGRTGSDNCRSSFLIDAKEVLTLASAGAHPLLLLRPDRPSPQRVLLPHDGSISASRAIRRFVQSGLGKDREVRLLAVGRQASRVSQSLREMTDYCRAHDVRPESGFLLGSLRRVLVPYIRHWEAGMVVLGAPGPSRISRFLFGRQLNALRRETDAAVYFG